MSFYKSGFRRVLRQVSTVRAKTIELAANEKSDDTSRASIQNIVTGHTSQINTLNTFKNHDNQTIYTEELVMPLNEFMFVSAANVHNLGLLIPNTKVVNVMNMALYVYNPEAPAQTPTYNTASIGHEVFLTRNSDVITANSTVFTSCRNATPTISFGQTGSTTWLSGATGSSSTGAHMFMANMDPNGRRSADHLNLRAGGLSDALDTKIGVIAAPQTGVNKDTTAAGAGTKIKLIVQYRLVDYPTLD